MLKKKKKKKYGFFFFFLDSSILSLLLPIAKIANQMSIVFSCFQQSLLKCSLCVHDKYAPAATCRRNKPQHENTKASLFSYVNKSLDGSFVRLCLLILVFFLDNLFPVTILLLKLEVMLTISFHEKSIRRCGLGGWRGAHVTHTHTRHTHAHTQNPQEGLTILDVAIFVGQEIFFIRVRRE